MRTLIICAAALGLFMSVPTPARDNGDHGDKHNAAASGTSQSSPSSATHRNNQGRAMTGKAHFNVTGAHKTAPVITTNRNTYLPASGDVRHVQTGRSVVDTHRNRSGWSANNARSQQNYGSLRLNAQASRRFHGGSYLQPTGYQYRHWGHGERLPSAYYGRNYWISNFLMVGLFAPPPELVWVRVGDDALLIDRYSGEIVQVRYGVFY